MCEYYHVVPWYNSAEWHNAYNAIYSENVDKQEALNLLLLWKARNPSLPSGIESTLSLLQVHIQDINSSDNVGNDQILRLAYSSAVMRFVNHMLDSETARGASLYQAARNLGVPDWVIDLRHDTAHSNNLPSLTLLRNACEICLNWLHKNYWDKHAKCIQDYTSGQANPETNDANRINALIYLYSCLSICKHCKIKKISDIPDVSMQESIVNDARDLLGALIDFSNIKTVSVGSLINLIDVQAKKFLTAKDTVLYVNNALLGEESLLLSMDLVDFLSKNELKKNKLSRRYVHCFEVLLTFLHKNDLLLQLVVALIDITLNDNRKDKCLIAALWVSEILASLKKSKQYLERTRKVDSDSASNRKKDLKQMYFHWFPNEKATGLVLDLHKPVPTQLTDVNFWQPVVSFYNPYLTYFVNDLLMLAEPKIPQEVCSKICKLAKLISAPDNFPVEFSPAKIYTIDDVLIIEEVDVSEVSVVNEFYESEEQGADNPDLGVMYPISNIWKIASRQNWSSCPIGQVVPQDVEMH